MAVARSRDDGAAMRTLLTMAVLPAAILLIYVHRLDPVEKEPRSMLWGLLVRGMVSVVPAIVIETLASQALFGGGDPSTVQGVLLDVFVGLGFAIAENVMYVLSYGPTVAVTRVHRHAPATACSPCSWATSTGTPGSRRREGTP